MAHAPHSRSPIILTSRVRHYAPSAPRQVSREPTFLALTTEPNAGAESGPQAALDSSAAKTSWRADDRVMASPAAAQRSRRGAAGHELGGQLLGQFQDHEAVWAEFARQVDLPGERLWGRMSQGHYSTFTPAASSREQYALSPAAPLRHHPSLAARRHRSPACAAWLRLSASRLCPTARLSRRLPAAARTTTG